MGHYYAPRWLHEHVEVAGQSISEVPATAAFANREIYNWELRWLSLTGRVDVDATGDFTSALGGVARRLRINAGISQQGDINLVRSNAQAMIGPERVHLNHDDLVNSGIVFEFDPERPVILPADTGMICKVKNKHTAVVGRPAIMFYGFTKEAAHHRNPVHLAGSGPADLAVEAQKTLDQADLFNDGEHEVIFSDMIVDALSKDTAGTHYPPLDRLHWNINPSTGVSWMPNPLPIPAGCIAPFNRTVDTTDQGPRVYTFPPDTILRPKQRLSLEFQNLALDTQEFDIALFGYLEVK